MKKRSQVGMKGQPDFKPPPNPKGNWYNDDLKDVDDNKRYTYQIA